eukprot:363761-Chlamydomonas_euryale.AAC.14
MPHGTAPRLKHAVAAYQVTAYLIADNMVTAYLPIGGLCTPTSQAFTPPVIPNLNPNALRRLVHAHARRRHPALTLTTMPPSGDATPLSP